ncbi:methylated-DNA--[protein]-cysteine S-methyltransferase [Sphingomonas soli]|uniref:methylated-DNA--[protein]-cysteine S-methyltransferase n=1 Tax=Sphingomonas soli TaxID=266127 RepID=UPI00082D8794|nr:methylated-DNA--[protein]-cysteine S-methyltransferase [Sphingomonas soli]
MTYARDMAVLTTPIGPVRIQGDAATIHAIHILTEHEAPRRGDGPAVIAAAEQLEAWFEGALQRFDLALAPPATPRGLALRQGLIDVGYGETVTYGALAQRLGSASRAIGQLCARNPFPIIVPCHRVLSSGGRENYSAGEGPKTKSWLLDHERRHSGKTLL